MDTSNKVKMETPLLIKGLYKKPFRFDAEWGEVIDKENRPVIDIRDYTRFDDNDPTMEVFGEYVTKLLNDNYEE